MSAEKKQAAGAGTPAAHATQCESVQCSAVRRVPIPLHFDGCTSDAAKTDQPIGKHHEVSVERMERACERVRRYREWREENPAAFAFIERTALEKAKRGQRVGGSELIELVRSHDFTGSHGLPTKIDNTFGAILVRDLISRHPELRDHFELRATVYDLIPGLVA